MMLATEPLAQAEGASVAAQPAPANLTLLGHLLLPVSIFVVSTLVIDFAHVSNYIGTLWPSNAIILVALLRHARNLVNYGSILFGGFAAIALAGIVGRSDATIAVLLAAADIAEVVIALVLLSFFKNGPTELSSFKSLVIFIVVAGCIAPIASAIVCAPTFGAAHGAESLAIVRNWYASHALGMIVVAPFLMSVTSSDWQAQRIRERVPEAVGILAIFLVVCAIAAYFRPVIFILAPAILFATIRFGLIGATVATFVTTLLATGFVVLGLGQPLLGQHELSERILNLQIFLAILSFWSIPTAGLLAERDHLLTDLSLANLRLAAESESKSHLVVGLRRHLSTVEENERLRLSHELHDQAGQGLIAAILQLNEIDPLIDEPARERAHLVRRKMEDMGKTLHRIAWELRPPSIDELGLRKALASYIADWGEHCDTDVDFHCDELSLDDVPNDIATAVYRVVQEGLTNIVKHARRPSNVSVVIRRADATLQVIIEDDGCGFDAAAIANRRGLGLHGMRERLSLIGGILEVESAMGGGTTLFARISLDA
jgi:signal transduction histidine kinase